MAWLLPLYRCTVVPGGGTCFGKGEGGAGANTGGQENRLLEGNSLTGEGAHNIRKGLGLGLSMKSEMIRARTKQHELWHSTYIYLSWWYMYLFPAYMHAAFLVSSVLFLVHACTSSCLCCLDALFFVVYILIPVCLYACTFSCVTHVPFLVFVARHEDEVDHKKSCVAHVPSPQGLAAAMHCCSCHATTRCATPHSTN